MRPSLKLTTAALAAFAFSTAAQATNAAITWGEPVNVSGTADVATNGIYVDSAVMLGANEELNRDITINGVKFHAYSGNFTVVDPAESVYELSFNNSNITYAAKVAPGTPTTPGDYEKLFAPQGGGVDNYFTTSVYQLTLGGLTAGKTYQVQLWANNWDVAFPALYGDGLGNNVTLNMQAPDSTAQFVIGTFTAIGSTESITYLTDGSGYAFVPGAISLRDITGCPKSVKPSRPAGERGHSNNTPPPPPPNSIFK